MSYVLYYLIARKMLHIPKKFNIVGYKSIVEKRTTSGIGKTDIYHEEYRI